MMLSRRKFTQVLMLFGGGLLFSTGRAESSNSLDSDRWFMPEESDPHKRTWMSFVASYDIWEERQVPEVQRNLATIAKTIAKYEPVTMLVRRQDYEVAMDLLGGRDAHNNPIELIEFNMNDLWIRDTGPAFVINEKGQKIAVNFNFNGWGEDQAYGLDRKVADFVAKKAGVKTIRSSLVLEGGCFEVDGQGTAIMTESCIINDNRNPGRARQEIESELKELLGFNKIIRIFMTSIDNAQLLSGDETTSFRLFRIKGKNRTICNLIVPKLDDNPKLKPSAIDSLSMAIPDIQSITNSALLAS